MALKRMSWPSFNGVNMTVRFGVKCNIFVKNNTKKTHLENILKENNNIMTKWYNDDADKNLKIRQSMKLMMNWYQQHIMHLPRISWWYIKHFLI